MALLDFTFLILVEHGIEGSELDSGALKQALFVTRIERGGGTGTVGAVLREILSESPGLKRAGWPTEVLHLDRKTAFACILGLIGMSLCLRSNYDSCECELFYV